LSQVFSFNCSSGLVTRVEDTDEVLSLLPAPGVTLAPNGCQFRLDFERSITHNGLHIDAEIEAQVERLSETLFAAPTPVLGREA
jgi:hypothetical protein